MKQWTRIIAGWSDKTYIKDDRAELVYKIILDFSSEEQAINFRLNFKDGWDDDRSRDNSVSFTAYPRDTYKNITLTKFELNDIRNGDIYWLRNKLPLNTTHFEFNVSVSKYYKNDNDNNGLEQDVKQQLKSMFEKDFNAQVQVEFIPPKMKDLKDETKLSDDILNRKDTLFEGLSTNELKHYDFIIVGRTQEEVDKLNSIYVKESRYSEHFWTTRLKEDIKKDDYDNKRGDMAYLKTKSDTLDSGIYCFTTRARNYFSYYKDNMLLPVFLDAKASQLGGKVVVAKKINQWTIKKSNYFDNYTENIRKKKYIESLKNEISEKLGIIKEDLDNKSIEQLEEMLDNIQ